MGTKKLNGLQFEKMLHNGLAYLRQWEDQINRLNVFPVADGDTGTNMCQTLQNSIRVVQGQTSLCQYLKNLSQSMLFNARGNSGVILSQFFKGMYMEWSRYGIINPGELRDGLIRGYKTAYASMVQPVEGTILTVTREGIEHIRNQIDRSTTMETLLSMYIAEMRKSLATTPTILQELNDAGVVDSGGLGFIILVEGMLKYLQGEIIEEDKSNDLCVLPTPSTPSTEFFNENSIFEKGYCLEFVLQLMRGGRYNQRFRLSSFIEDLKLFGSSLAVVQEETRVKVHIHTKIPAKVIGLALDFGEFVSFKLENMQIQHNENLNKWDSPKPKKDLAVICVVNGDGMKSLFLEMGCDGIIDGGSTMNTSSQEFIDVFARVNADTIVVLPNHKNNIMAAEQAVALYGKENIHILPTKSLAEAYFAIAMDVGDSSNVSYRIEQMHKGAKMVTTLAATTATRDYSYHEICCHAGDEILLTNDQLTCVSSDWLTTILQGLRLLEDIASKESCLVFRGCNTTEPLQWELEDRITAEFPNLEVTCIDAGQDIYPWILGVV